MAEAVVDRFVHAYSYDDARGGLHRLQTLPSDVWTPDLGKAVQEAVAANDQINQAVIGFDADARNVGDEALLTGDTRRRAHQSRFFRSQMSCVPRTAQPWRFSGICTASLYRAFGPYRAQKGRKPRV
jgi:hypothetical protein